MSEYQYYEFLALDRPLDARQQNEVRGLSTRARVTATTFVNEYHWGNFRGDPRTTPANGSRTQPDRWRPSWACATRSPPAT